MAERGLSPRCHIPSAAAASLGLCTWSKRPCRHPIRASFHLMGNTKAPASSTVLSCFSLDRQGTFLRMLCMMNPRVVIGLR